MDNKDRELGELVRKILERSNVLNIHHTYEYFLIDSHTKAECTINYERNGKPKKQNGDGPRDAMKKVAEDLEGAATVGRMHAG